MQKLLMNNNRNETNNSKNTIAEWSFSSIVSMSLYYRGSSQKGGLESLVFPSKETPPKGIQHVFALTRFTRVNITKKGKGLLIVY